jgi:DNA-binding HxlR family transcriptional regulator
MQRGYGQYCPIAKGAEVFAERWTPLIVRNVHLGCHTFSDIHEGVPRMSTTLLSSRLRTLERAGVIDRRPSHSGHGSRYYLTPAGHELADVAHTLGTWAARWLELAPADYDPYIVLWGWKKLIDPGRLPPRRVVVRFELSDRPREHYWLLVQRPEAELCVKNPGLDEDLTVTTDSRVLAEVHRGRLALREAVRTGQLRIEGSAELVRAFPNWGGLSVFAGVARARTA